MKVKLLKNSYSGHDQIPNEGKIKILENFWEIKSPADDIVCPPPIPGVFFSDTIPDCRKSVQKMVESRLRAVGAARFLNNLPRRGFAFRLCANIYCPINHGGYRDGCYRWPVCEAETRGKEVVNK